MLAQYVFSSADAPFRIVKHGHRWRALHGEREFGRFETPEEAALSMRDAYRDARLPRRLSDWRFLPAAALGHLSPPSASAMARLAAAA